MLKGSSSENSEMLADFERDSALSWHNQAQQDDV
jgi:hypothetical protein